MAPENAATPIRLIVGLGNPGPEYAETRHNAGFRFLEALARERGVELRAEPRFNALAGKTLIDGREVWLLAPQTFMNRSGDAVVKFAHYYKIPPEAILVVHDELDLPPGTVRLKRGGGAGGHNGLSDVIAKLGSRDFVRLRVGIGHPGNSRDVVSFVLKRAPASEAALTDEAMREAQQHLADMVKGDLSKVMNVLHRAPKAPEGGRQD